MVRTLGMMTVVAAAYVSLLGCDTGGVGPSLVSDAVGPGLNVSYPIRAASLGHTTSVTVSGTVGDTLADVSFVRASRWGGLQLPAGGVVPSDYPYATWSVASNRSFSGTLPATYGLNVIETWAEDSLGLQTHDVRSVLVGSRLPAGSRLEEAFVLQVDDSAAGLGALGVLAAHELDQLDLDALVPDPVYTACDPIACTWSVDAYVEGVAMDPPAVVLQAEDGGWLGAEVQVPAVLVPWRVEALFGDAELFQEDGEVWAEDVRLMVWFRPVLRSDGTVGVEDLSVDVVASSFDVDVSNILFDALEYIGVDFDGVVYDAMRGAMDDVGAAASEAIAEQLSTVSTDLTYTTAPFVTESGWTLPAVQVHGAPSRLTVSEGLVQVAFDAGVSTGAGDGGIYRAASLSAGSTGWGALHGIGMGVDLGFVNQYLSAARAAGAFDRTVRSSTLGIDASQLELLFPGIGDAWVTLDTQSDPVMVACHVDAAAGSYCPPRNDPFDTSRFDAMMQLGDVHVTVWNSDDTVAAEADVSMVVDAGLEMSMNRLAPVLGDTQMWVDVQEPSSFDETLEAILRAYVLTELPNLTGAMSMIEVPAFEGVEVVFDSAQVLGTTEVFGLDGTLQVQ